GPSDIAYIANHANDKILILDDVLLPLYDQFKDQTSFERVIVIPFSGAAVPEGYDDYEAFLDTATGHFEYPEIDETDGCAMCYTSGTTGVPKGVIYSHRGMMLHSITAVIPDMLNFSQDDTVMPVVPMFHANAWGMPYAAALVGCKQVFPGPHLDAESLLDLAEVEKVNFAGGVPTIWLGIAQAMRSNSKRWTLQPNFRTVVGGSAAPPALIKELDEYGIQTVHAWGMTEMSPLGTVSSVKPHLATSDEAIYAYRAKQGVAAPFIELRAVDDEQNEVPWDGQTMGELEARGPWVAAEYHDNDDATDKWTADGWFKTGDIVAIDSEGYVQITDRSKDVVKSGGEWISSVDLENAIMGHPAVVEAAVIALPHPKWDERPLACVVLAEGKTLDAEEIREFLADDFAKWQLPDAVVFIDEVPKTSTGKF
ncbi:MAG: long-chain fatty acid--CoA ligase, partial [bacterium]|nr:long-chain fatty acid--CoA ligase [bacterium]